VAEPSSRPWHGLELRHLAALTAVIEEGSFHRAARRLGYSQSAVSQQVAALERATGHRLIDRGAGERVRVTKIGSIVLRHAEAINSHLSAAQADVERLTSSAADSLKLGVYQSVSAHLFPRILTEFVSASSVEVVLTETVGDIELFGLLERGELELAFVVLPATPGPFEWTDLLRDQYVLVVQNDSPLASVDRLLTVEDVATLPLICFRACRSTEYALASLRSTGAEPRVMFRSDDNEIVQGMVAAGLGAALIPSLAVSPHDDLVVLGLDGFPPRITSVAWHRDRSLSPAAGLFVDVARRVSGSMLGPPAGVAAA
jgi:DNA-binding transcriptional LysR family regulator